MSFNNLTIIRPDILLYTPQLEYLDLSSNSLSEFSIVSNNLRYLNLDNNQIKQIDEVLWEFYFIEIFTIDFYICTSVRFKDENEYILFCLYLC